jgi:sugar phosphate isomerase/epimerase
MSQNPIAIQMYTVREAATQDLLEALRRVAQIGYAGVELAGLYGNSAQRVAQTLRELNLQCVGSHVPLQELQNNLSSLIDTYQQLDAKFLACPWLPPELRQNESDYRQLANDLNRIGQQCRANGLGFCYHHHDFEFVKFNGKFALDILLEQTDPANVQLEADAYWIRFVGLDPAEYIRRWQGRAPLIHLKDMTATQPPTFAEVGAGILQWPTIFEAAQQGPAQWYIVEQDKCAGDPFDSIRQSFDNLNRMLTN